MSHGETTTFLLAIALLIGSARILGEIAQRFRQPSVLGELIAGVPFGPTVLGYMAPALQGAIFPTTGAVPVAIAAIATLSITLFLAGCGRNIRRFIAELAPVLRGWITYYRHAEVKGILEELDRVDTQETALPHLAAVEAATHPAQEAEGPRTR